MAVPRLPCLLLIALAVHARAQGLPPDAMQALQNARVPEEAVSVILQDVGGGAPLLSVRPDKAVNPASLTKLITTYAALDRLGPAWTWSTPVWLQGRLRDGVLDGSVFIKGSGDP